MKRKRFPVIPVLLLCVLLLRFPAGAAVPRSGTTDSGLSWTLQDGLLTVSGSGAIPDYAYNSPDDWRPFRNEIRSAVLESGVTSVGGCAFAGCVRLTEVSLPAGLTTVGECAFSGCAALSGLSLPDSVTLIGSRAFENCSALTELSVPSGVTAVAEGCFCGCSSLTMLTLPASAAEIGNYAFSRCSGLTELQLPASLASVGEGAFLGCSGLTELTLLVSVTAIGADAFSACGALDRLTVEAGNPVFRSEGNCILSGTTLLFGCRASVIPSGVTSIGAWAFDDCSGLRSAAVPDGVTDIGEGAFRGCSGLSGLSFTGSVTTVGSMAFSGCSSLSEIFFGGSETAWNRIAIGSGNDALTGAEIRFVDLALTAQPEDYEGDVGGTAVFSVSAVGTGLSYRWEVKTADGDDWQSSSDSGSQTNTIRVPIAAERFGSLFRCVITDANGGTLVSDAARLMQTFAVIAQPEDRVGDIGDTVYFTVSATGTGLSYQWQVKVSDSYDWLDTTGTGCHTASLKIPINAERIGYRYRCIITCGDGRTLTTETAQLLPLPFAITAQPEDYEGFSGGTATFSVSATGTGLSYRWHLKTSDASGWQNTTITGYRTDTITVPITAARLGYRYRCVVTDASGAMLTSEAAQLKQADPVVITAQPTDFEAFVGDTSVFSVSADGVGLSFQWQLKTSDAADWKNTTVSGYRTGTITVPVTAARLGYRYRCVITDAGGNTVTSEAAQLKRYPLPVFASQPADFEGDIGDSAVFSVSVPGSGLSYRWQLKTSDAADWKDTTSSGYRTDTLTVPVTAARLGYRYRCIVTDAGGGSVISEAAQLKPLPLSFTVQPTDFEGRVGENAIFSVTAVGTGLSYQWQLKTSDAANWKNTTVSGYRTDTVTIPITEARIGYRYRCVVTDAAGNTVSSGDAQLKRSVSVRITAQPADQEGGYGDHVLFSVAAEGEGLSYLWQTSADGTNSWTDTDHTFSDFPVTLLPDTVGTYYRCIVSCAGGTSVVSDAAQLKRVPYENHSGITAAGFHWTLWNGTLTVTGTGAIPDYEGNASTDWLAYRGSIESLIIGSGITGIGAYAFGYCSGLTSAALPDGLSSIGYSAFTDCVSLNGITIPDSVTSIGDYAFCCCGSLTGIGIPDGVTGIGESVFGECGALTSVTLPTGLTDIGDYAFYMCSALTELSIPDGVTHIGPNAFCFCSALTELTLPNSLVYVEDYAFYGLSSLSDVFFLGTEAQWNSISFLLHNEPLQRASLHCFTPFVITEQPLDYAGEIGETAIFSAAVSGSALFVQWQVKTDPTGSWEDCLETGSVTVTLMVPITADRYGYSYRCVFTGENGETAVTDAARLMSPNVVTDSGTTSGGIGWALHPNGVLTISGSGSIPDYEDYQSTEDWLRCRNDIIFVVISEGITGIGEWAFAECPYLLEASIPAGLTDIGYCAFCGCSNLNTLTVNADAMSIDDYAFFGCYYLRDIFFSGSAEDWGRMTIGENNDPLTTAALHFVESLAITAQPMDCMCMVGDTADFFILAAGSGLSYQWQCRADEIAEWQDCSFIGCRTDTLSVPVTPERFGSLYRCIVTDENGETETSESALLLDRASAWIGGTTVTGLSWDLTDGTLTVSGTGPIPDYSADSTDDWRPWAASAAEVCISDGVTGIGSYAFCDCVGLTELRLPNGLLNIGVHAFDGCLSLISASVPGSVTSIGSHAFDGCTALTDLFYGGSAEDWSTAVTGTEGSVPSGTTVHTIIPLAITAQPQDYEGNIGDTAVFSVEAVGTELSWQWQVKTDASADWQNCTAELTLPQDLTVTITAENIGYLYRCIVRSPYSSDPAVSEAAELKETPAPLPYGTTSTGLSWSLQDGVLSITGSGSIPDYSVDSNEDWLLFRRDITSVVIGNGVAQIGSYAFNSCFNMTALSLPDGIQGIGLGAFRYCSSLKSLTVPDSVRYISTDAFLGCHDLKEADLGSGLTSLGTNAFTDCFSLTEMTIPDGVTAIHYRVFSSCSNLTEIHIPVSVSEIDIRAFSYCSRLSDIYYSGSAADWSRITFSGSNSGFADITLHFAVTFAIVSQPVDYEGDIGDRAAFSVEAVGTGLSWQWQVRQSDKYDWHDTTVTGCDTDSISVSITAGRLGYRYRCVITDALGETLISEAAELKPLPLVILSQPQDYEGGVNGTATFSVSASGSDLGYQWQLKTSDAANWANTTISGYKTDTVTVSITSARLGYRYRCVITDAAGNVIVSEPAQLKEASVISHSGIAGGSDPMPLPTDRVIWELRENGTLIISGEGQTPDYIITEGETFEDWLCFHQDIRTVIIEGAVTSIGSNAFYGCCCLEEAVIGNGVSSIGDSAFCGCPLTKITIPTSVTEIGDSAFNGCSALSDVYFLGSEAEWNAITIGSGNEALTGAAVHCILPLTISSQPTDYAGAIGDTASFSVSASGSGLCYQWQVRVSDNYNWQNSTVSGYRTNTITNSVTAGHIGYRYRCVIIDENGSVLISDDAQLKQAP